MSETTTRVVPTPFAMAESIANLLATYYGGAVVEDVEHIGTYTAAFTLVVDGKPYRVAVAD